VCVRTCLVFVNMRPCMHIFKRRNVSKLDLTWIYVLKCSLKKSCVEFGSQLFLILPY
jgi:hypothetical protein